MTESLPDPSRAWEAYGHAIAAALSLELFMRLANAEEKAKRIKAKRTSKRNKAGELERVARNVMQGGFGDCIASFESLFGDELTEMDQRALSICKESRDVLVAHFLAGYWLELRSERGLDRIAATCALYGRNFQDAELRLREIATYAEAVMLAAALEARAASGPFAIDVLLDPEMD